MRLVVALAIPAGVVLAHIVGTNVTGALVGAAVLWGIYWLSGRGARRSEGKNR